MTFKDPRWTRIRIHRISEMLDPSVRDPDPMFLGLPRIRIH